MARKTPLSIRVTFPVEGAPETTEAGTTKPIKVERVEWSTLIFEGRLQITATAYAADHRNRTWYEGDPLPEWVPPQPHWLETVIQSMRKAVER